MTQLIFYTNPMSRGRIVRWMLEEIGVDYETKVLEYGTTMKAADYLAINPMGKVPAIKHGDIIVTESAAICAYLADTFKEANLAPANDKERGAYFRWLFFASGPLVQSIELRDLAVDVPKDKYGMLGCGNPGATLDVLTNALGENLYIAGDRFTAADVYIGSYIGFGMQMGFIEKHPKLVRYWELVSNRPARLKAVEIDTALIAKK